MTHRSLLLAAAAAAAVTLAPSAEAFGHPGRVPLRSPGGPGAPNAAVLRARPARADGLAARPRRVRAASGVHGLQAQADLAASLASGANSLSGAAVLCGVIAFHEMGHFLAAKVQGIRINDFSIGFGPKLLGFQDRDGVTYSFRLFPLGGFVSFPEGIEEDDETAEEGAKAAGGAEGGDESDADKEPVYSFDDPDLIQNRPALQRALVISAGVIFNMILSWSAIFASVSTIGITTPVVMPGVAVPGIADPNGAAARYGLNAGSLSPLPPIAPPPPRPPSLPRARSQAIVDVASLPVLSVQLPNSTSCPPPSTPLSAPCVPFRVRDVIMQVEGKDVLMGDDATRMVCVGVCVCLRLLVSVSVSVSVCVCGWAVWAVMLMRNEAMCLRHVVCVYNGQLVTKCVHRTACHTSCTCENPI